MLDLPVEKGHTAIMLTEASRKALEWAIEAYDAQGFKEGIRAAGYALHAYPATPHETSRRRGGRKRAAGVVFSRLHRLGYLTITDWAFGVPLYVPTEPARRLIQELRQADAAKLSEPSPTVVA